MDTFQLAYVYSTPAILNIDDDDLGILYFRVSFSSWELGQKVIKEHWNHLISILAWEMVFWDNFSSKTSKKFGYNRFSKD